MTTHEANIVLLKADKKGTVDCRLTERVYSGQYKDTKESYKRIGILNLLIYKRVYKSRIIRRQID
jgi:hypothetical protein